MPSKPMQKFYAWSYSRWRDYTKCPQYAKYKHLDKLKEPEGPALARGSEIHSKAERFVNGALKILPEELRTFTQEFKDLKKLKPKTEQQLALDRRWSPTDWFAKAAWVRVVIDAMAQPDKTELTLIDHKTGKVYEDAMEQLSLYAATGFSLFPEVEEVTAQLWFIDAGELREERFVREQEGALQKTWEERTVKMLSDTKFEPTPGAACRWCAFSKAKGGSCKY